MFKSKKRNSNFNTELHYEMLTFNFHTDMKPVMSKSIFSIFKYCSKLICEIYTYQLSCRMLCKPNRGKPICAAGQQCDNDVDKCNPVGKVGSEIMHTTKQCCESSNS